MSRRFVFGCLVVGLAALLVVIAYRYGQHRCPPPGWWFKVFHRGTGTYRCAG
jgi:hypothetical protein